MPDGIRGNAGQATAAALVREERLRAHIKELSRSLASYRKQHNAGYENGICCTCVLCVWTVQLIERSQDLTA